ncbi:selenium-dependent molybdenum cofactor biosynthesis protein YqeB [Tepidimicrobium xylanilyticum]|uniref:Xanthine dehydrogenase accessory factor n=1 Tax=Tepidimicrobium xylanilyticum TaxID=1123352 RepID=A0A1H2RI03_9FIRM|nr:selenium-dependent molybdenum cofactor biosynthesis protein YqeB [Tepidimicrobium xylanilyticum]GMG95417.1 hypothetical protein EN5CB1_02430 [Tepidimicrobium xylanilyticum]SDW18868.1 xanthine dehydrogenase accessory factor [Tepidimicrobium xylanilyticum]
MDIIIIRGGGDLASGIAYKLYNASYKVVILEIDKPLTVRRSVAFSEAVYEGETKVEGIKGVLAGYLKDIYRILEIGHIPVCVDANGELIDKIKPLAVVDAIMAKRNIGTYRGMAPITIGVGPGFEAGVDVDCVIESNRGANLGKVIFKGRAEKNTGIPAPVMGYAEERVLRAPTSGIVKPFHNIGDLIRKGEIICEVGDKEVVAKFDGVLRGMIKEGIMVEEGLKIGDIDPRCRRELAFSISDKAKVIGDGTLKALECIRLKREA